MVNETLLVTMARQADYREPLTADRALQLAKRDGQDVGITITNTHMAISDSSLTITLSLTATGDDARFPASSGDPYVDLDMFTYYTFEKDHDGNHMLGLTICHAECLAR